MNFFSGMFEDLKKLVIVALIIFFIVSFGAGILVGMLLL